MKKRKDLSSRRPWIRNNSLGNPASWHVLSLFVRSIDFIRVNFYLLSSMLFGITVLVHFLTMNCLMSMTDPPSRSANQLTILLQNGDNNTMRLFYNLTTNYSYYLTFRSFGQPAMKFGLYSPVSRPRRYSLDLVHSYQTSETFYLWIICFHFLLRNNDLDIQCKDIRQSKTPSNKSTSSSDFLPTYNPLFVPLMYALSVLMLFPMVIQHHRQKKALILQRQKALRRLSLSIAPGEPELTRQTLAKKLLSRIVKSGKIPIELELIDESSDRLLLEEDDDNGRLTFTLENLRPWIHQHEDSHIDQESRMSADDCISHLLNSMPWKASQIEQSVTISSLEHVLIHDEVTPIHEDHIPTMLAIPDDDELDDRKPVFKLRKYPKIKVHRTFFESDVWYSIMSTIVFSTIVRQSFHIQSLRHETVANKFNEVISHP